MTDPLSQIEDRKTWMDFGRQALLLYRGAKDEGASDHEAMLMVTAFYAGMFKGSRDDDSTGTERE